MLRIEHRAAESRQGGKEGRKEGRKEGGKEERTRGRSIEQKNRGREIRRVRISRGERPSTNANAQRKQLSLANTSSVTFHHEDPRFPPGKGFQRGGGIGATRPARAL